MPNSLVKSYAKKHNMSVEDVELLWKKAKEIAAKSFPSDDRNFYAYVVGILKKMLKAKVTEAYLGNKLNNFNFMKSKVSRIRQMNKYIEALSDRDVEDKLKSFMKIDRKKPSFNKVLNILEKFPWLGRAKFDAAEISIDRKGFLIWNGGIWKRGVWVDGTWEDGHWVDGTWTDGVWYDGMWSNGHWENGKWERGFWYDGTWKNGVWWDGRWMDGTWEGGTWNIGYWHKGTWKDGTWRNGTWENGVWKKGTWEEGLWMGGTWKKGKWLGGYDAYDRYREKGDSPDKW